MKDCHWFADGLIPLQQLTYRYIRVYVFAGF